MFDQADFNVVVCGCGAWHKTQCLGSTTSWFYCELPLVLSTAYHRSTLGLKAEYNLQSIMLSCFDVFLNASEVKHCFMSEVVQFKQKFLLEAFNGDEFNDCCLFSDATKVFTDERECLRHKDQSGPCSCEPHFWHTNMCKGFIACACWIWFVAVFSVHQLHTLKLVIHDSLSINILEL